MTNKDRLEYVLNGNIPDYPPHFELDFYLWEEMFGITTANVLTKTYSSEIDRQEAILNIHIEQQHRLVEELDYACVYFNPALPPEAGITRIKKVLGDKALIRTHEWYGVFWMPAGSEIMDFVVKMFERPKEMHEEARRKCDAAKELLKIHADAGADFFMLCYDFGFNDGPFISPKHFSEFVTPYLTEIVETVHELGKKALLHSDGDLRQILDQIYATGVDGYQSVDPQGNMDIKEVREKYPDWILMGNVNCSTLQDVNEKKIRSSVQYCMEYGGIDKPYIFSTSNCIYPGMPKESYYFMLDEYHRLCSKSE